MMPSKASSTPFATLLAPKASLGLQLGLLVMLGRTLKHRMSTNEKLPASPVRTDILALGFLGGVHILTLSIIALCDEFTFGLCTVLQDDATDTGSG